VTLTLSGDFAALAGIEKKLSKLATAKAKKAVLMALEEEAINQVLEGFDAARDPYGRGWAPTIRGEKILQDTGGLKRSLFRKSDSDSFTIGFSKMYAAVHQFGAEIHAKATRRVEYTTKMRHWRKGGGRSGAWDLGTGGGLYGGYRGVTKLVKLLTFKIGNQWISKESVTIPARRMLPDDSGFLPGPWREPFVKAATAVLKKILRG